MGPWDDIRNSFRKGNYLIKVQPKKHFECPQNRFVVVDNQNGTRLFRHSIRFSYKGNLQKRRFYLIVKICDTIVYIFNESETQLFW